MKKELPAAVVYLIIAIVVIVVVGLGYKILGPKSYVADTKGSEQMQKKYEQTGTFYTPPAGRDPRNTQGAGGQ